jgi:hypothetical protein
MEPAAICTELASTFQQMRFQARRAPRQEAQALALPPFSHIDDRDPAMVPIDSVLGIIEAAKGKTLTARDADWLIDLFRRQDEALKQLVERNRALKDAVELYRLKAAHMEAQLHSPGAKQEQAVTTGMPPDSPGGDRLSSNARRILSSLASRHRSEFSSGETPALSHGMGPADLEAAINELLDHELIEELSYTPFEGTRFGCTARGAAFLKTLSEPDP